MSLTSPYRQYNYMGEFATEALALAAIQDNHWDSLGTGFGDPQQGMFFFDTAVKVFKFYNGNTWRNSPDTTSWQPAIAEFYDPTPGLPPGAAEGERYIASATANGWTIDYIYEYRASVWAEIVPTLGCTLIAWDTGIFWSWNGVAWQTNLMQRGEYNSLAVPGQVDLADNANQLGGVAAANYPTKTTNAGNPNGAVSAVAGSFCLDTTNVVPYVKLMDDVGGDATLGWRAY